MNRVRKIHLRADQLQSRQSVAWYMSDLFHFPEGFVQNLTSLQDCLEEVNEDTDILLSKKTVKEICQNAYAFKVLLTIGKASDQNSHLRIRFTE